MDIKDAKDCGICTEEYDDDERCPRILPCFHTLCSSCIADIIRIKENKCPFCRLGFEGKKAANFRINNNALELIKYVKVLESQVSSRGKGFGTLRASSIQTLKKRVVEINCKSIAACKEAASKMNNIIQRNNECKKKLITANTNILTEIISKSQEIVNRNIRQIQVLEIENSKLEAHLRVMNQQQQKILALQNAMENAKTFTTAGPLIDEAEHINSNLETTFNHFKVSTDRGEKMHQRFEENCKAIQERISLIQDMFTSLEEEIPDVEISPHLDMAGISLYENVQEDITTESLNSINEYTKSLIEQGRIFAVQLSQGRSRFSRISISSNKYLCLHHLNDGPVAANVHLLKYDDVVRMVDSTSRLTFIELTGRSQPLGKLFIRLDHNAKIAQNFQMMCTGISGPSYAKTKPIEVLERGTVSERVCFGDYENGDGSGGKALLTGAGKEWGGGLKRPWRAGIIWSPHYGENKAAQFDIWVRERPGKKLDGSFGYVEDQLHVLTEAISKYPNSTKDVAISDCGVVLKSL